MVALAGFVLLMLCPSQANTFDTYYLIYPDHKYAVKVPIARIRQVDFRNITLHVYDKDKEIAFSAHLRDGLFEETITVEDLSFREWVGLESVHYLDFQDGEPQQALVLFAWVSTGATATAVGVAQLFEMVSGRLVLTQQILYESEDGAASYDASAKKLTIKATSCAWCEIDEVVFQWSKGVFVKDSERKIPPRSRPQ